MEPSHSMEEAHFCCLSQIRKNIIPIWKWAKSSQNLTSLTVGHICVKTTLKDYKRLWLLWKKTILKQVHNIVWHIKKLGWLTACPLKTPDIPDSLKDLMDFMSPSSFLSDRSFLSRNVLPSGICMSLPASLDWWKPLITEAQTECSTFSLHCSTDK